SRMVVYGGINGTPAGSSYDPAADLWTPISTVNDDGYPVDHTAVWTGTEMIVWGGEYGSYRNVGGRYDPAGDSWSSTSLIGAPTGRSRHTAIWTGVDMVVWGGAAGSTDDNSGGRYDPAADLWTP